MENLNGSKLKEILLSGVNAMTNNIERINLLNVFPVPDGDTGSNMGATAFSAYETISNLKTENIGEISSKFARGMLLGARGNSGVILSQIFKGFSVILKDKDVATQFDVVEAFKCAKKYGYNSVMQPIEGTILTVIKVIAEDLDKMITPSNTILEVFEQAVKSARKACDNTPNLLPILKEVGVTDSGGEGLFLIVEGMKLALEGKPVSLSDEQAVSNSSAFDFFDSEEEFDGEFGYCTEFIVELKEPKNFKKDKFEQAFGKMGNSIVYVHDEEILKAHIHTLNPGKVFTYAQKFGELLKLKSENMTLQANESANKTTNQKSQEKVNIGVISCHLGSGIIDEAKELGVDFVIEGGQTTNPSASDFIKAIENVNSDKIIILPNNSNVILAARQVAQTIQDKEIIVIPTKTQMQGLIVLMNFDREGTMQDNEKEMNDAISQVKTGQITKASRTTKIEGVQVKDGEYLAMAERKIVKSTNSKTKSAIVVAKKLIDDDTELVTIFYGDDSTEIDAEEVASFIETHYDVEVEIKNGKQPVYNFLIAFE